MLHARIGADYHIHFKTNVSFIQLSRITIPLRYGIATSFYPRDAMLARVFATAKCLSACLSVTRRYCQNEERSRHHFFTIW